ncbi:DUF2628 domain-containing protein [Paenisporosarcina indica]|uniref:DUF2628 domain-containing protein n=1 Tax=Paenisporosarcina indica TaxID=650093 RepID=UPI00094FC690|nr:DUF2628 domain-containing protein [Paenisporosarcina indica]
MFCGQCGSKLDNEAKFCQVCGNAISIKKEVNLSKEEDSGVLSRSSDHQEPSLLNSTSASDEQLLRLFVGGKKQDYYLHKWSKKDYTWNWAAFIFGVFWLGYRKMFTPIFIMLGIFMVIDLGMALLGIEDTYQSNAIGIGVGCTLGILGNSLYRHHANKNIHKMKGYYQDPAQLQHNIKLKGNGSWTGVFLTLGLFALYLVVTMVIFTYIPSINQSQEALLVNASRQTSDVEDSQSIIEEEILDLIQENTRALESEDQEKYMSMIHKNSDISLYEQTKETIESLFDYYDIAYDIRDIEFLSVTDEQVKVRLTQTTTLLEGGDDFRDNDSILIHTFKPQDGTWKFSTSEVESVSYFDETNRDQTLEDAVPAAFDYFVLEAPDMFGFYETQDIDVNNDGLLETVTFTGGTDEDDSYSNSNVEITVEFKDGSRASTTVSADNAPVLYLYDIEQDGWMELFYETGYRVFGTDIYRFTPDGLEYDTTLSGRIEEFSPYQVTTSEEFYTFD